MKVRSEYLRLLTLIEDTQQGQIGPSGHPRVWSAPQVEALWDNILNDWPVGPLVILDGSTSPKHLWRGRIGPYPVRPTARRRLLVAEGAEKLAALAWSLLEPESRHLALALPEERALWGSYTLVLDVDRRRPRFVGTEFNPQRQLPVRLLPHSGPCLEALKGMELRQVEREWLNFAARRLSQAQALVFLFDASGADLADRMIANYRQINNLVIPAA